MDGLAAAEPGEPARASTTSASNGVVLAFTAGLSIATGVAVRARAGDSGIARRPAPGDARGRRDRRARPGAPRACAASLVVGEFALALVLLVGAALLVQSFWRLQHVESRLQPGVGADGAALAAAAERSARPVRTSRTTRASRSTARVLDRDRGAARRRSGGRRHQPAARRRAGPRVVHDRRARARRRATRRRRRRRSSRPATSARCGIDAGRAAASSTSTTTRARRWRWSSARASRGSSSAARTPIGKRIAPGRACAGRRARAGAAAQLARRSSAIVRDVKSERARRRRRRRCSIGSVLQTSNLNLTLVVRTSDDPSLLAESIRREVRAVDPNEPVFSVRTMDAVVAAALARAALHDAAAGALRGDGAACCRRSASTA